MNKEVISMIVKIYKGGGHERWRKGEVKKKYKGRWRTHEEIVSMVIKKLGQLKANLILRTENKAMTIMEFETN